MYYNESNLKKQVFTEKKYVNNEKIPVPGEQKWINRVVKSLEYRKLSDEFSRLYHCLLAIAGFKLRRIEIKQTSLAIELNKKADTVKRMINAIYRDGKNELPIGHKWHGSAKFLAIEKAQAANGLMKYLIQVKPVELSALHFDMPYNVIKLVAEVGKIIPKGGENLPQGVGELSPIAEHVNQLGLFSEEDFNRGYQPKLLSPNSYLNNHNQGSQIVPTVGNDDDFFGNDFRMEIDVNAVKIEEKDQKDIFLPNSLDISNLVMTKSQHNYAYDPSESHSSPPTHVTENKITALKQQCLDIGFNNQDLLNQTIAYLTHKPNGLEQLDQLAIVTQNITEISTTPAAFLNRQLKNLQTENKSRQDEFSVYATKAKKIQKTKAKQPMLTIVNRPKINPDILTEAELELKKANEIEIPTELKTVIESGLGEKKSLLDAMRALRIHRDTKTAEQRP